MSVKKKYI